MKIDRIFETCLGVDDVAAAERFYAEVLGLKVVEHVEGLLAAFRCGAGVLLLFDKERARLRDRKAPPHDSRGEGHVAFAIDPGEIDAWRERLNALGVPIETEVVWDSGATSIYFRDPDGNSLELVPPRLWGFEKSPAGTTP